MIHLNVPVPRAGSYSLQGQTAFFRLIGPGLLHNLRVNHSDIEEADCNRNDILFHANPLDYRLVDRGAPQMLEQARRFHRYSRILAALPTQPSRCAARVSKRSCVICLSASVAGTDFCARNRGSCMIFLINVTVLSCHLN